MLNSPAAASPQRGGPLSAPPVLTLGDVALFADLDGTLAPLKATPDGVKPDPDRRRLLDALSRALSGRLAVISGRSLDDLDRVLEGRVRALGAVHGLVRRTAAGVVTATASDACTSQAREAFLAFAQADEGLLVEDKGPAVALHYRSAPKTADACRSLAEGLAADLGLKLQQGDMVVELCRPGLDKGRAVEAFVSEPPFAGYMPVFLGDDLTDEAGFRAVQALGGFGVVVGARRPTFAIYGLPDVEAVQSWLRAAIEAAA